MINMFNIKEKIKTKAIKLFQIPCSFHLFVVFDALYILQLKSRWGFLVSMQEREMIQV